MLEINERRQLGNKYFSRNISHVPDGLQKEGQVRLEKDKACTAVVLREDKIPHKWLPVPCNKTMNTSYICKINILGNQSSNVAKNWFDVKNSIKSILHCAIGFLVGKSCFTISFVTNNLTFAEADTLCVQQKGKLLELNPNFKIDSDLVKISLQPLFWNLRRNLVFYPNDTFDENVLNAFELIKLDVDPQKRFSLNKNDNDKEFILNILAQNILRSIKGSRIVEFATEVIRGSNAGFTIWTQVIDRNATDCYYVYLNFQTFFEKQLTNYLYNWSIQYIPCSSSLSASHLICEHEPKVIKEKCKLHHMTCSAGSCVSSHMACDGFNDCPRGTNRTVCEQTKQLQTNGSEWDLCLTGNICSCGAYNTMSADIICDGISHCNGSRDEKLCPIIDKPFRQYVLFSKTFKNDSDAVLQCKDGGFYPFSSHCHYTVNFVFGCMDASNLHVCEKWECEDKFKCHNSYCIDYERVCDGIADCLLSDDEDVRLCANLVCPGRFRCRAEKRCLKMDLICDGQRDCFHTADDEISCEDCPTSCTCQGTNVKCNDLKQDILKSILFSTSLTIYSFFHVDLTLNIFLDMEILNSLDISNLSLLRVNIYPEIKKKNTRMRYINMSENNLEIFEMDLFGLFPSIVLLDLSHNAMLYARLVSYKARGQHLEIILLRNNRMSTVPHIFLKLLPNLVFLDISGNPIVHLHKGIIKMLTELKNLSVLKPLLCCFVPKETKCVPQDETRKSIPYCANLLTFQQILVFGITCVGLFWGNFIAIARKYYTTYNRSINSYFIFQTSVLVCNLLTSLYLCSVIISSYIMSTKYYVYVVRWQRGAMCQILQYVSFLSLGQSLFTFAMRAFSSFWLVYKPLKNQFNPLKSFNKNVSIIWILNILFSAGLSWVYSQEKKIIHMESTIHFNELCNSFTIYNNGVTSSRLAILVIQVIYVILILGHNILFYFTYLLAVKSRALAGITSNNGKLFYNILSEILILQVTYVPYLLYLISMHFSDVDSFINNSVNLILICTTCISHTCLTISRIIVKRHFIHAYS